MMYGVCMIERDFSTAKNFSKTTTVDHLLMRFTGLASKIEDLLVDSAEDREYIDSQLGSETLLTNATTIRGALNEIYGMIEALKLSLSPDYVRITVTGATFSPIVELVNGSTSSVLWEVEGGPSYTGISPVINFGSSTTRYVRLKVLKNDMSALNEVTTFNIGFNNTQDGGRYMVPSSYNHAQQQVTGLDGVNLMTGLVRFLAATPSLTGSVDFSGMSNLQFIECYQASLTSINLTGCTSLIRLCVEDNAFDTLDLNPVAGNLRDIRCSLNAGTLTFVPLSQPLSQLYHYCVGGSPVVNHPTVSQLPVVEERWEWSCNQSGTFVSASNAIRSIWMQGNNYTSADFLNQFPAGRNGFLRAYGCLLSSINLTGCSGLTHIELNDNSFDQAAVDSILTTVASWNTSDGFLDLTGNDPPSSTGLTDRDTLVARGWNVTVSTIPTPAFTSWSDSFDRADAVGVSAVGNGWHTIPISATIFGLLDCNIVSGNIVLTTSASYGVLVNPAGGNLPNDYTVSMVLPPGEKGGFFGLVGRWYNGNGVRLIFSNEEHFYVGSASGWDIDNVANVTTGFPTNWLDTSISHTVAMKMLGSTIEVILDGVSVATCTSTINMNTLGTEVGFCGEAGNRARSLIQVTV